MATIHPSRAELVTESNDGASSSRESELRQRLHEQKARSRTGQGQDEVRHRRESPVYESHRGGMDVSNSQIAESRRYYGPSSTVHAREGGWKPPHAESHFFEDRNGAPPPGAWPQRDPDRRRAQAPQTDAGGWLESRQQQRNQSHVTIWPSSPTSPYRSESEEKERRRKERRDRHHRKEKRHTHRHRDERKSNYSDESGEESKRTHRRRHKERRDRSRSPAREEAESEDQRRRRRQRRDVEARRSDKDEGGRSHHHRSSKHSTSDGDHRIKSDTKQDAERRQITADEGADPNALSRGQADDGSHSMSPKPLSSRVIGPQMPEKPSVSKSGADDDGRAYGKALLPGEGSAMANFVQEGQRIPRRGEIGLKSDQIEAFEKVGFVMSGSRHQRMNAVRMRKENQVYSAEEQRSMLKMIAEEKQKKEAQLIEQFKDMVDSID